MEVGFEGLSLLFYTPLVVGWVVLPLGLVLVVTLASHGIPPGWWALAWLRVAGVLLLLGELGFVHVFVGGSGVGLPFAHFGVGYSA